MIRRKAHKEASGSFRALLATYLAPQGRRVAWLTIVLLGGISLELIGPQVIRWFIDSAIGQSAIGQLTLIAAIYLVVAVATQGASVVQTYLAEHIGWTATNALRSDLTRHALHLDRGYHLRHTPGEMIERIDGDVTAMGTFFSQMVVQLGGNLVLLLGIIVLCFRIDWRVGTGVIGYCVITLIVMIILRRVGVARWGVARQASANLYGFIEERLSGMEDVRALGAVKHVLRQLGLRERALLKRTRGAALLGSTTFNALLFMLAIGTTGALGIGAYLYFTTGISIGTVYLIYSYFDLLRRPIEDLSRQLQEIQQATASIARVQELFATKSALPQGAGASIPAGPLTVEFDDVRFGYADGEGLVLDNVSFSLPPGGHMGLLGRTGSGKTTIARLLFRLHDVSEGNVRIGGVDTRKPDLATLRSRIGMVTQEIQLFHATVRDNLTFFDDTITDERIITILRDLDLDRWLASLSDGLDTTLSPDGSGLSAGEAQLLAFARVFLQDPGLVILDEASARLDLATEQTVTHAIERLLEGRTGIIIAHRLATVQRVDTILLLDDGHIAEYGARATLAGDPESRFAHLLRSGMAEVLA